MGWLRSCMWCVGSAVYGIWIGTCVSRTGMRISGARVVAPLPTLPSPPPPVCRLGGRARIALGEDRAYLEYLPDILNNYGRFVRSTPLLQLAPQSPPS